MYIAVRIVFQVEIKVKIKQNEDIKIWIFKHFHGDMFYIKIKTNKQGLSVNRIDE